MRWIKDQKVVHKVKRMFCLPKKKIYKRKTAIIIHVYVSQINMLNNVCLCLLWFSFGFAADEEGN